MRLVLARIAGIGGLLMLGVGGSHAQSSPPPQSYGNPQQYLSAPGSGARDEIRSLSVAPSTGPVSPEASAGSSRELSPRERHELLQPATREAIQSPGWGSNRDRN